MAAEVLVPTPAVRAVIREGKTHQMYSLMQAGQKFGMQTMNQALQQAVIDKKISLEEALERSSNAGELEEMLDKVNMRLAG
jgi:twitching motility protein PilT